MIAAILSKLGGIVSSHLIYIMSCLIIHCTYMYLL